MVWHSVIHFVNHKKTSTASQEGVWDISEQYAGSGNGSQRANKVRAAGDRGLFRLPGDRNANVEEEGKINTRNTHIHFIVTGRSRMRKQMGGRMNGQTDGRRCIKEKERERKQCNV